jgi:predicted nucleic-acid-binding protein
MIGFNTNPLVRLLVRDDPAQAADVDALIEECLASGEAVLLNGILLCENAWVLESAYGFSGSVIGEALEGEEGFRLIGMGCRASGPGFPQKRSRGNARIR